MGLQGKKKIRDICILFYFVDGAVGRLLTDVSNSRKSQASIFRPIWDDLSTLSPSRRSRPTGAAQRTLMRVCQPFLQPTSFTLLGSQR